MHKASEDRFSLGEANWSLGDCVKDFIIVEECLLFILEFLLGSKFYIFEVSLFFGEKIDVVY